MRDNDPLPDPIARARLLEMITGYWVSQAVFAAAKLGVADRLRDGPRSCEDLAEQTGVLSRPLHRLLRALASVGVFHETETGRFGLSPIADGLRSDVADSLHAFALLQEYQYGPWGAVLHSLETDQTAFDHIFGESLFDYLADRPDAAAVFNEAMANQTAAVATALDR